jgi:lysophospholipase L1-like esterase
MANQQAAKPTSWRRKLIMVASGLLIGATLCEVMLRVQEPFLHIMALRFTAPYPSVTHPVWDHWAPPNVSVTIAADDLEPYEFFTNSLGCRHPQEIVVPKPADIKRVLILGDSFTEGYRFEDTIAPRLERRLNERTEGQRFEVINGGCTTYSPILHYLRLKNQWLALEPDYIILNIDQTDIFDDYWRYRPKYQTDANGEPLSAGSEPPNGWRHTLHEWGITHSYLLRVLSNLRSRLWVEPQQQRERLQASKSSTPLPENIFAYHSELPVDSAAWKTEVGFCLDNIARIIQLCKQRNTPIYITLYPHKQHLKADEGKGLWNREFEKRVAQLCREREVGFFSAYEGMAQAFQQGQPIFREKDIHYTNLGQRVWGDLIADYFVAALKPSKIIGSNHFVR